MGVKHCDRWPEHSFGCWARRANVPSLPHQHLHSSHSNSRRAVACNPYLLPQEMRLSGLQPDTVSYNTLINGYKKRGDAEAALRLYEDMVNAAVQRDGITYNTLIKVCESVGDWQSAMSAFLTMLEEGFEPDRSTITYNSYMPLKGNPEDLGEGESMVNLPGPDAPGDSMGTHSKGGVVPSDGGSPGGGDSPTSAEAVDALLGQDAHPDTAKVSTPQDQAPEVDLVGGHIDHHDGRADHS